MTSNFQSAVFQVYPLDNYTTGTKDVAKTRDQSQEAKLKRMKERHAKEGLRRTVRAILLVHQHSHPFVLTMEDTTNGTFSLPGGKALPGESEINALIRRLDEKLKPKPVENESEQILMPQWTIGELLATWWRPNFDENVYPYLPIHVSRPIECERIFVASLPEKCAIAVPSNYKLTAVPLYDLYDNSERFGPELSAIPQLLSRFQLACL